MPHIRNEVSVCNIVVKTPDAALLQGTLELLILHALQRGFMHGYTIAQTIHLLSDEVLRVEGSGVTNELTTKARLSN